MTLDAVRSTISTMPICYVCGRPAAVELSADYPMGVDIPAMHYEQRDGLMVVTTHSCAEHMWGVAADLPHPTVRPL